MNVRKPMAACFTLAWLAACSEDSEPIDPLPVSRSLVPAPFNPELPYTPDVEARDLGATLDNPLFPAPVGARWVYSADTEEGLERIEVVVLPETRPVWGTTARVVRDTVRLDGDVVEDTWDWYAQDLAGNVWYLGEDTSEYEDGNIVCNCGAWEAGVSAALPGVIMLAQPAVGDVYRQEYLEGEAEDLAEVVSLDASVSVAAGSWTGCTKTRERSAVEPELDEFKYYCPGVGNVLVEEDDVRVELVEYSGL